MKKAEIISFALFSLLGISCSEKPSPDSEKNGWGSDIPEGNVEVSVLSDRKTVLRNPLSGWVIYAPLMDDVDAFWNAYDNMHSSSGTVRVSDYATVLYLRGSWTDFNPEEGVYIWQDGIDMEKYPKAKSLKALEEGAKQRDLKLAFTLKTDSRDANAFCTPEYVRDKMIAKYGADSNKPLEEYYVNPGKDGIAHTNLGFFVFTLGSVPRYYWSPYPDDPVFQEWYGKFINALADEYNDPEKTMFISGLGMGKWGEYHTCVYSTGYNDSTPREAVFNWVTDLYVNAFDRIPVVTNYHKFVGCTYSEGEKADPNSASLLASAIEKGFCMRHDAFGMKSKSWGYSTWEKEFIANWTYKVPVLGEGGWVQGSHDYSSDYANVRELREGEYNEMNGAYVTMMDLRYSDNVPTGETYSWFNDAFDLVTRFVEEDCYRVYPDKLTIPSKIINGKEYTIQHRWLNLGHAYCPTNIKQYKDRFKVAFAILNTSTGKIAGSAETGYNIFLDENACPHEWTSGRMSYDFKISPDHIPAGPYDLAVGIVDLYLSDPASGDYKIGIHLGAQGDFTEDGWLKLGKVSVADK